MNGTQTAEYRVDDEGNIDLYVDGEQARIITGDPDIRRVPTKKLQRAILAALDNARRLGAAHGPCDRTREIGMTMGRKTVPGCASFVMEREQPYPGARPNTYRVLLCMDGEYTAVFEGMRGATLAGYVARALERAFKVGGVYGPPLQ